MRKNIRIWMALFAVAACVVACMPPEACAGGGSNGTCLSDAAYRACVDYGESYGICPELLMAVAERESGGNPRAENRGCRGLMQINPRWNAERMRRLGVNDLYDERQNIRCGADLLFELFERYGDVAYALDKYNGNSKADYNYENGILSGYAGWILDRSRALEERNGK